jgi:hypothetical protein
LNAAAPSHVSGKKPVQKKDLRIDVAPTPYATFGEMGAFRAKVCAVGEFSCEPTGGAWLSQLLRGYQLSRFRFNIFSPCLIPKIPAVQPKDCHALQKPDKFAARSELTLKNETRVRRPHAHQTDLDDSSERDDIGHLAITRADL